MPTVCVIPSAFTLVSFLTDMSVCRSEWLGSCHSLAGERVNWGGKPGITEAWANAPDTSLSYTVIATLRGCFTAPLWFRFLRSVIRCREGPEVLIDSGQRKEDSGHSPDSGQDKRFMKHDGPEFIHSMCVLLLKLIDVFLLFTHLQ